MDWNHESSVLSVGALSLSDGIDHVHRLRKWVSMRQWHGCISTHFRSDHARRRSRWVRLTRWHGCISTHFGSECDIFIRPCILCSDGDRNSYCRRPLKVMIRGHSLEIHGGDSHGVERLCLQMVKLGAHIKLSLCFVQLHVFISTKSELITVCRIIEANFVSLSSGPNQAELVRRR